MLAEVQNARQVAGEGHRRWFTDKYFDLIIWYEDDGISGIQLCYDKEEKERALTWRKESGYSHEKIDDGETPGHMKMTPILVPDGAFSKAEIAETFNEKAAEIDPEITEFVYNKIMDYQ